VTKVDLREYLATQGQERRRAFILHAPAMEHKTALARRMRDLLGAYLLDLQAHFLEHPELAERVDRFRPRDLEELLLGLDVPQKVVVVDNVDFLLNTWTNKRLGEFVGMVDLRLKSPDTTDKTFVFVVQTNPVLLRHELKNSRGQPRILPRDAFYALRSK
jgi:hypothetical protein